MLLLNLYKLQSLNKITGFWDTLQNFNDTEYVQAISALHNEYKLNNSKQYRLIKVTEELVDYCCPPGS